MNERVLAVGWECLGCGAEVSIDPAIAPEIIRRGRANASMPPRCHCGAILSLVQERVKVPALFGIPVKLDASMAPGEWELGGG